MFKKPEAQGLGGKQGAKSEGKVVPAVTHCRVPLGSSLSPVLLMPIGQLSLLFSAEGFLKSIAGAVTIFSAPPFLYNQLYHACYHTSHCIIPERLLC